MPSRPEMSASRSAASEGARLGAARQPRRPNCRRTAWALVGDVLFAWLAAFTGTLAHAPESVRGAPLWADQGAWPAPALVGLAVAAIAAIRLGAASVVPEVAALARSGRARRVLDGLALAACWIVSPLLGGAALALALTPFATRALGSSPLGFGVVAGGVRALGLSLGVLAFGATIDPAGWGGAWSRLDVPDALLTSLGETPFVLAAVVLLVHGVLTAAFQRASVLGTHLPAARAAAWIGVGLSLAGAFVMVARTPWTFGWGRHHFVPEHVAIALFIVAAVRLWLSTVDDDAERGAATAGAAPLAMHGAFGALFGPGVVVLSFPLFAAFVVAQWPTRRGGRARAERERPQSSERAISTS